jgi:putative Holliday junction resolvase
VDAAQVAALAIEHAAVCIIVGQSFDEEGRPNAAGRSAARFAEALRLQTSLPVEMWDESLSTQDARASRIELGVSRKKRTGHHDSLAAVVILQSYLEAYRES